MNQPVKVLAAPAELIGMVGRRLGVSSWREVGQSQIDAFGELTGDRQWIHMDPDRAAVGPFGVTIAHGYLLLSLVSAMLDEIFRVDGADLAVNKGLDRLRFRNSVPAGSRVRAVADVVSATPATRGYVDTVLSVTVEIEGQRNPAYTMESHVLYHSVSRD